MKKSIAAIICLLLLPAAAGAAKLKVRLYDDQGKPLPEAEAKVVNVESKKEQMKKANKKGELSFDGLSAGEYTFVAQKQGFLLRKLEGIKIEAADIELDIKLYSQEFMKKGESEANALFAQNDFKGAIARYEEILKVAPDAAIIWANIAKAAAMVADWEKAAPAAQKAAELDPGKHAGLVKQLKVLEHYQKGQVALDKKNFPVAESELLRARETDPENADVLYALALAYGHQTKFPEAIKICEDAIKLRPMETSFPELLKILKHNAELAGKK
jgi:tetratricopeptide (TPR) repeat protein